MQARQLAQLMPKKSRHRNLPTVCKACFPGLKAQGRLVGILNGVDENIWHPNVDQYIPHHYKLKYMAGKKKNKAELQAYFNLPQDESALAFVMVTRLTEQKGVDLLIESADEIVKQGGQLMILGSCTALGTRYS